MVVGLIIIFILIVILVMQTDDYKRVKGNSLTPEQKKILREQNMQAYQQRQETIKYYKRNKIKYCPHCLSINVQYYKTNTYGQRDAKIKTSYSANLNPLKPFTLVNKKEKVVKKASAGYSFDKWHCMDCGRIFNG